MLEPYTLLGMAPKVFARIPYGFAKVFSVEFFEVRTLDHFFRTARFI